MLLASGSNNQAILIRHACTSYSIIRCLSNILWCLYISKCDNFLLLPSSGVCAANRKCIKWTYYKNLIVYRTILEVIPASSISNLCLWCFVIVFCATTWCTMADLTPSSNETFLLVYITNNLILLKHN